MILDDIANQTKLNDNERQLLQYILEHLEEVPSLSSRELARRTYMSSTGVLRCIKKLGFDHYNDFKLNINSYLKNHQIAEAQVTEDDEALDLMHKMSALNESVIRRTKEMISMKGLNRIVKKMDRYPFIDVIANDENAELAEYASHNFAKAGKLVTVYKNGGKQMLLGFHVSADHLVLVISKYGENENILKTMRVLKKRGIPVISIISKENKKMEELSDDTIWGVFDQTVNSFRDLIFGISVKYILDLLYAAIFSRHYEKTITNEEMFTRLFRK